MSVVAWITGVLVTMAFLGSGVMKLRGHDVAREVLRGVGVDRRQGKMIGVAEILGAVAVFIGLVSDGESYEWIGLVGAVGLMALLIGAIMFHQQAGDPLRDMAPSSALLALTLVFLIAYFAR